MKKLVVMLALLSMFSIPVAAQDGLNPTSEQLDEALQQMEKTGFDTSQLPSKEKLKQMLSGENGRRVHEMAKKIQEQNPEQFQQMQQKLLQRFDKNGDGTLGPRERELAQQAFQQRQSDGSGQDQGNRPQPGDRALERFDHNDDGQLGPREHHAANRAREQHQQGDNQNSIRLKRRSDESPSRRPDTTDPGDSRHKRAPQQASDRGPRPDGASDNRSSRPGGQQGQQQRANADSRQPQSRQSNSNDRPGNPSAGGRDTRPSGGANRGGPSGGGANRGGAARSGSAGRSGR